MTGGLLEGDHLYLKLDIILVKKIKKINKKHIIRFGVFQDQQHAKKKKKCKNVCLTYLENMCLVCFESPFTWMISTPSDSATGGSRGAE